MKKAIVAFAAASILTACGREVVIVQAPPETTTTAPATTTTTLNTEDSYIERATRDTSLVEFIPKATLIDFAYTVCDFFASGGTTEQLATVIYTNGVSSNLTESQMGDFAILAGIAVDEFCPEYWPLVEA